MFDRLLAAARKGGWPAVYTVFGQGETIEEPRADGGVRERPARRRTLIDFLDRRPDLKALIDNAANEKRDELLANLQSEVEAIAMSEGDVTFDYGKDGRVTRKRVDRRNKLHAILKLLAAHDPETYADRRKVDVAGQIAHDHQHRHAITNARGFVLEPDVVRMLPADEQGQLFALLEKLETLKDERYEPIDAQTEPRSLPAVEETDTGPHQ